MRIPSDSSSHLRLLCAFLLTSGGASAQWSVESLSQPRAYLAAASVGDLALFAGGNITQSITDVVDTVDIYDASDGSWSVAALSEARSGAAAVRVGDLALFAGGRNPLSAASGVVDVFDSSTGQWSAMQLSQPRVEIAAAAVGSLALFAGGYDGVGASVDTVDIYDSSDGSWTTASLSEPRRGIAAATLGSRVYFTGGWENPAGDFLPSGVVDVYDASSGLWSTLDLPVPQAEHRAVAVGAEILLAAGSSPGYVEVLQVLDAATGTWRSQLGDDGRWGAAAAVLGNEALYGGGAVYGNYVSSVHIYDGSTGLWRQESLSIPRTRLAAATAGSSVLFAGGVTGTIGGSTFYSTVDIYTPVGVGYCGSNVNSTGHAATLDASGSVSIGENDLELAAGPVPDEPFVFFFGTEQVRIPFGDGFHCVAGALHRLHPTGTASAQVATQVVDLPAAGITSPGSLYFQCWFRDPGAGGSGFNLSDGLSITFKP